MLIKKGRDEDINIQKIVDNIRCLGIDMIDNAKSGHPGIVLGAAPIIFSLYANHLKFNVNDPKWINRDRFVLSAGHGSALLYSTLFMAGYNISVDDLKTFRQIGSKLPGHPEYGITDGVDMSTGPLGQGFASAVGMAISERYLASIINKKDKVIDYYTYVLCGDGDLMEGVSYEAASLAGNLKLNKLIVLYDSNDVCLDGFTNQTFNDNIEMRFNAMNWNVIIVSNGEDTSSIDKAIIKAKTSDKPTLIQIKTTIGKFSKNQGSNKVHGSPLDEEDITEIKKKLNLRDIPFTISNEAITNFRELISDSVGNKYEEWLSMFEKLDDSVKMELDALKNGSDIFLKDISYELENDKEATRMTSSKVLNAIARNNNLIIGGSADLSSSNKTYLNDLGNFSKDNYGGRNIFFGVREHAMASIANGMALCGLRPFVSTFLSFSDYLKPAIRLAAIMNLPVVYIFTHDSIDVGEDGPTHQPIEQLIALRSIPNLEVFRPADANEVLGVYKTIYDKKEGPSAIILGRNDVIVQDTTSTNDVSKGAYIVKDVEKTLNGIIIATGKEVGMAINVANNLKEKGLDIRVVSMPSIERFKKMPKEYQEELLPITTKKIVIEASSSYSWHEFVYNNKYLITLDTFGYSGKSSDVEKKMNFDLETICERVEKLLK